MCNSSDRDLPRTGVSGKAEQLRSTFTADELVDHIEIAIRRELMARRLAKALGRSHQQWHSKIQQTRGGAA